MLPISYIPKNERQGLAFFYPLYADLLRRRLERGEKSKPCINRYESSICTEF